jgi:hypothetical protein
MSKVFQLILYITELLTAIPVLAVLSTYLYRRVKMKVVSLFMVCLYFLILSTTIRTAVFLVAVARSGDMTDGTIFVLAILWTIAHFIGIIVMTVFSFLVYRKKFDTFINFKKREEGKQNVS